MGRRYENPDGGRARGLLDVLRWKATSRPETSPPFVADVRQSKPPSSGRKLSVTMVNHSTVLVQQAGCAILTDPVWSERASPFAWTGPRRRRAPGVRLEDLPPLDAVLISHNHYDHLDLATLRRLAGARRTRFVVPAGVGALLRSQNLGPVDELAWGESVALGRAVVHCVPAQHFSGRGLFDRDRTLWCGYVIEAEEGAVYYAADTGFGSHFARIRERFGSPRLALLPIGAYLPRWFMSPVHMDPEEAVRAHTILGAETSIAIHHGTFQLADEAIDTPKKRLRELGAPDSFLILENGQSWTATSSH